MIRPRTLQVTRKASRARTCLALRSGGFRIVTTAGVALFLSACATSTPRPQIPIIQEAAHYREHAKSYYAPPGPPEDPWGPYIVEASKRFDVPDTWIRAVMMQESGGKLYDRHGRFITSAPGAMGLMQLMPPTYDDMRAQYNLGPDAYDPHDNIMAGTAYIRQMYDIYGSPGFLAAYNDGPGSLDSYLRRGRILPRETRRYVASIGPQIAGISPHNRSSADLLVARYDASTTTLIAQNDSEVAKVRAAWRRQARHSALPTYGQNVQVAEMPANGAASGRGVRTYNGMLFLPEANLASYHTPSRAKCLSRKHAGSCGSTHDTLARNSSSQNSYTRASVKPIPIGKHLRAQPIVSFVPPHHSVQHTVQRGAWAIQVGAYKTHAQASHALAKAHAQARQTLAGANPVVSPVKSVHKRLYQARLTHLSRANAVAACRKMGRTTPCTVVSPKAKL